MIKEKEILVLITRRNVTYYKKLNYNVDKINTEVLIKIEDINKNSHQKITAICDKCGNETILSIYKYYKNKDRCGYYGCKSCSNKKREIVSLEKYGVSNPMKNKEIIKKQQNNNIKKYGVKTTLLEEKTKEKIKKTNLNKYGVEVPLSSNIIREKSKKTLFEKYGVNSYSKTEEFKKIGYKIWEKLTLEKLQKYNIKDFKLKDDRTIDIKCDLHKEHYYNINSKNLYQRKEIQHNILCTICNPIETHISGKELEILNFIKNNYDGKIIENDKTILNGKELDIYLPELNLAFEFNGIYWHSELYKEYIYHKMKSDLCENNNIQLIHIWEDEWFFKKEIVKSIILNKLNKTPNNIYARKCEIKEINDNKLIRKFLMENHIQGFIGSNIKIGLFYNNELVSLMTFGNKRINLGSGNKENNYEMLRFCNKINTNIVGGASKLFKYFITKYKPESILTYADRSYFNGNLYKQLGFNFISKTAPGYSYYDQKLNKYNRFNFRKDILVKEGYDKNKTENEIMLERGFFRVFNAGNLKYIFNIYHKTN
ncbi:MAG: hypothetical protein HPY57_15865 [Ignavibacteria bacterium]|nr:hypothetical protein [Ignavibacteria bacterium]